MASVVALGTGVAVAQSQVVDEGTADETTIETEFIGTVDDTGTIDLSVTGLNRNNVSSDGDRVTFTVGGEPAAITTSDDGTASASFNPETLDIESGQTVTVDVTEFDVADTAEVDIVDEVRPLDSGFNILSVPQSASASTENVDLVNVWDSSGQTYDGVDLSFDNADDLSNGLYINATSDDARFGFDYAGNVPVGGTATLDPGWNLVSSNYPIDSDTFTKTVEEDLTGINVQALESTQDLNLFSAKFETQLTASDSVDDYDAYWAYNSEEPLDRGVVSPPYSAGDRVSFLGNTGTEFNIDAINVEKTDTSTPIGAASRDVVGGSEEIVEADITVTNDGSEGAEYVDLEIAPDPNDPTYTREARRAVELSPGETEVVTLRYQASQDDVSLSSANADILVRATTSSDSANAIGQTFDDGGLTIVDQTLTADDEFVVDSADIAGSGSIQLQDASGSVLEQENFTDSLVDERIVFDSFNPATIQDTTVTVAAVDSDGDTLTTEQVTVGATPSLTFSNQTVSTDGDVLVEDVTARLGQQVVITDTDFNIVGSTTVDRITNEDVSVDLETVSAGQHIAHVVSDTDDVAGTDAGVVNDQATVASVEIEQINSQFVEEENLPVEVLNQVTVDVDAGAEAENFTVEIENSTGTIIGNATTDANDDTVTVDLDDPLTKTGTDTDRFTLEATLVDNASNELERSNVVGTGFQPFSDTESFSVSVGIADANVDLPDQAFATDIERQETGSDGISSADVVITLDTSGSMSGTPLDNAKEGAKTLVGALDDESRIAVVEFSGVGASVAQNMTTDKNAVNNSIDSLVGGGGTPMSEGINTSQNVLETQGDADTQDVMVTLADGSPDSSTATIDEALDTRDAAGINADGDGTRLISIAYGTGADNDLMEDISSPPKVDDDTIDDDDENAFVGTQDDITQVFQDVSKVITSEQQVVVAENVTAQAGQFVVITADSAPYDIAGSIELQNRTAGETVEVPVGQDSDPGVYRAHLTTDVGLLGDDGLITDTGQLYDASVNIDDQSYVGSTGEVTVNSSDVQPASETDYAIAIHNASDEDSPIIGSETGFSGAQDDITVNLDEQISSSTEVTAMLHFDNNGALGAPIQQLTGAVTDNANVTIRGSVAEDVQITTEPPATVQPDEKFTVEATPVDADGNPVANVDVDINVSSGPGTLNGTTTVTGSASTGVATFDEIDLPTEGDHVLEVAIDSADNNVDADATATTQQVTVDALDPANFDVSFSDVDAETLPGEEQSFNVTVTNTGEQQAQQQIDFEVDGYGFSDSATLDLTGGETDSTEFTVTPDADQAYGVYQANVSSANDTATADTEIAVERNITATDVAPGENVTVKLNGTLSEDTALTVDDVFEPNVSDSRFVSLTVDGAAQPDPFFEIADGESMFVAYESNISAGNIVLEYEVEVPANATAGETFGYGDGSFVQAPDSTNVGIQGDNTITVNP